MKRLALAAMLALAALPAAAQFDPAAMTAEEKAAFGQAVRDYLMTNPEVLVEAINALEQRRAEAEAAGDLELVQQYRAELFEDANSWAGGNLQGDLTMVEFIDYRCGVCRSVYEEVENVVKTDGNIRIIFKEFPILGPESDMSAKFAIATRQVAGDAAYKAAHDRLMTLRGNVTPESLRALAGEIGVDADAVLARMEAPEVAAVIAANHDLGQKMNLTGTPVFVIGDALLRGVPRSGLQPVIDQARQGG